MDPQAPWARSIDNNHKPLFPGRQLDKTAFTYQLSDHMPLWLQVDCDIDGQRLGQVLNR
jgi:hypothetical protein